MLFPNSLANLKRHRALWAVTLVVAALVTAVGWWADVSLRRAIKVQLHSDLETALEANVTALEIWMETQQRLAATLAEDPRVREVSLQLLGEAAEAGSQGTNGPESAPRERRAGRRDFAEALAGGLRTAGFGLALLVTTNLQIIGDSGRFRSRSASPVTEEHQERFSELFRTGEPVVITPFRPRPMAGRRPGWSKGPGPPPSPSGPRDPPGFLAPRQLELRPLRPEGPPGTGNPPKPGISGSGLMQVAAPLRDPDGVVRGALAFIFEPEREFSRILSVVRRGTSGETYAFDGSGLLLSQSRYDAQLKSLGILDDRAGSGSALTLQLRDPGGDLTRGYHSTIARSNWPPIHLVAQALAGGSGVEVEPSRDYRGVPVVGAWRWLPERQFGVVTQRDAAEAFQPLWVLRSIYRLLTGLLAFAAMAGLVVFYLNLRWRRKASEAELKLRTLGQYALEEKIGEGGMGVVYRAHHALLRRETAVKLLLPSKANEAAIRQFEREVRLTCGLTHPNTIQIYDFGRTPEGVFYYAMEFLRGLNLAEVVERSGPLPEGRILHILEQVCASLTEAHAAGLVHRDIKPANIILCERGGLPDTVKVLDFGLVQAIREPAGTAPPEAEGHSLSGTPNYLPPETIRKPGFSDPRGDLYALGAVAYFLATGRPVFDGETSTEILQQHCTAEPLPPRQRPGCRLGPELESLILRCLAKDPEARPRSAEDLRQDLAACPAAGSWTVQDRRAWWDSLRAARLPAAAADQAATRVATLKIDLAGRAG